MSDAIIWAAVAFVWIVWLVVTWTFWKDRFRP